MRMSITEEITRHRRGHHPALPWISPGVAVDITRHCRGNHPGIAEDITRHCRGNYPAVPRTSVAGVDAARGDANKGFKKILFNLSFQKTQFALQNPQLLD